MQLLRVCSHLFSECSDSHTRTVRQTFDFVRFIPKTLIPPRIIIAESLDISRARLDKKIIP
jgi:hypothetical protein